MKALQKDIKETKKDKKEIPVEKIVLPGIKTMKRNNSAIDEQMRTNYTSPPNLLDIFDLTSGVTIHENGKSKAAVVKKNNLNEKGRLRMNKTEYYQMYFM